MIIRHFIHIPKTGGSVVDYINHDPRPPKKRNKNPNNSDPIYFPEIDIHKTDSPDLDDPDYKTHMKEAVEGIEKSIPFKRNIFHIEHSRWIDLNQQAQDTNEFFALVRNPWARLVSRFRFMRRKNPYAPDLVGFIDEYRRYLDLPYIHHHPISSWTNQKDYVTDQQGNLKVDILRTETLNPDFHRYFSIPEPIQIPKVNVGNTLQEDYRTLYVEKTITAVSEIYADDIKFFGFNFEGPATKNII